MAEIRQLIEASALSSGVKRRSLAIFGQIAAAEAKMHHTTVEEVHFHEIGGLDSLLDIVGVAWCLEYLGVERIYCSALPLSSGWVDCAHGRMPVPAPATLEILKGATWTPTDLRGELVTPTGAGILAALVDGYGPPPALVATRVGAGAGKKQLPDRPNILRVIVGEPAASPRTHLQPPAGAALGALLEDGLEWRDLQLLESNIDDLNPELWDTVFERLLEAGALDVWLAPIQMKKNRPAQQLGVLCESSKQDAVMRVVLRETTTLGVRVGTVRRAALPRGIREVSTAYGLVRVKVTRWAQGDLERGVPEYEDVKRLSREKGIPAREVYEAALRAL